MPWNFLLILVDGQRMGLSGGPGNFTRVQARDRVTSMLTTLKDSIRDGDSLRRWTQEDQDMLIVSPQDRSHDQYAVWAVYQYKQDRYAAALSWVNAYCQDAGIELRIWQAGTQPLTINPN